MCRINFRQTLLIVLATLAITPAQAAAIRNLSGLQQTIEIATSAGYDARVIEPGGSIFIAGDVRIRYKQQDWRIDSDMEYAIWPGDVMGPQKRLRRQPH